MAITGGVCAWLTLLTACALLSQTKNAVAKALTRAFMKVDEHFVKDVCVRSGARGRGALMSSVTLAHAGIYRGVYGALCAVDKGPRWTFAVRGQRW